MSVLNTPSGILEFSNRDCWLDSPQAGSIAVKTVDPLEQLINELTQIAEIEAAIHSLCVTHMARCGLTSWDGGECALKFWCNGLDATLRWNVWTNPLESRDPPVCLLSVVLGHNRDRVLYGSVVADLNGAGPLLLSQGILSLLCEALQYEAV